MTHTTSAEAFTAKGTSEMDRETKLQVFSYRLHRLLIEKDLRQAGLARAMGCSKDAIHQYVHGKAIPGDLQLKKLADALGVKPDDLIPGSYDTAPVPLGMPGTDAAPVHMEWMPSNPPRARISFDRIVSATTALRIMELLNSEVETSGRASDDGRASN